MPYRVLTGGDLQIAGARLGVPGKWKEHTEAAMNNLEKQGFILVTTTQGGVTKEPIYLFHKPA
ncbi:hypothetical protein ABFT23_10505 [Nocardioides sp. C4-1]|uniref:hypothetical protein n=1 Tax=Nocardioides sp. C4-1 TaxID=3151851 RepID=UPI00326496F7